MTRRLIVLLVAFAESCARAPPKSVIDVEPVRLLNAFFGLDDALPPQSMWLCAQAPGKDGMPVTFSHRFASAPPPSAFQVTTASGATLTPVCATTAPANESSENHTVLLIGSLGSAADPPKTLNIVSDLPLAGDQTGRGLSVEVTSLEAGPTLVLAFQATPATLDTDCPRDTRQVVVVVWAGGVTPVEGGTAETHRGGYSVQTDRGDVTPFALADLNDQDNYVHLRLDVEAAASAVSFVPGLLVDPRRDPNPATRIDVSPAR